MDFFALIRLKNRFVRFKNKNTKLQYGDEWLCGHLTAVMSHLISVDGVPYSREDLDVEEIRNGRLDFDISGVR